MSLRCYCIALLLLFSMTGHCLAQGLGKTDPNRPGTIVFEPKKPGTTTPTPSRGTVEVIVGEDPNRPGYIVFFPSKSSPGAAQRQPATVSKATESRNPTSKVEMIEGVPSITIIGKGEQKPPTTLPPPTEVPQQGGGKPVVPQPAEQPVDGKILLETYDVAYCRDCKVGYIHTLVRQYVREGKTIIYGVKRLTLQVARFGQIVEQWTEESTIEDENGKIYSTAMRQGIGKNQVLELAGRVTETGLEVKINGPMQNAEETIPWPDGVLGVSREATLLKDMKPKPGIAVEYQTYFGQFNGVMSFKITAKGIEEVQLDENAKPQKLLKVMQEMKPVGEFRQPPVTMWIDPETYEPVALQSDMPVFGGVMTARRTTRDIAVAKPRKYLDLGEVQSIVLEAPAPGLPNRPNASYEIVFAGDVPLDKILMQDDRQKLTILDEATRKVRLDVISIAKPNGPAVPTSAPDKAYLSDSYFIDWNNELVKKHAASAMANVPKDASDWKKAQAVEAWVHANMKQVEFSQAMASCGTVAKELSGDCTEHAMLAVGMCRALGIPAKTALGLVYFERRDGTAILAYHMWYEVWVDGNWLALDAILGKGSVGPGHIKIAEAHWDGEKGMTPILPVLNVLGARPKVKVINP